MQNTCSKFIGTSSRLFREALRWSLVVVTLLSLTVAAKAQSSADHIEQWDFAMLNKQLLQKQSDTTYVINFWATWCKPCVEEMPAFLAFDSSLTKSSQKVRVVLVSLDFVKDLQSKLRSFVAAKHIRPQVVLFSDHKVSDWIDSVSKEWSGSIPATLIINNAAHFRIFHEGELSQTELEKLVSSSFNSRHEE